MTTGEEGDISSLCQFGWYEGCYFHKHTAAFPHQKEVLGRVLGPASGDGNEMCQWVLKSNGRVVPRQSVSPLQAAELHSPQQVKLHSDFDALIEMRYRTSITPPKMFCPYSMGRLHSWEFTGSMGMDMVTWEIYLN